MKTNEKQKTQNFTVIENQNNYWQPKFELSNWFSSHGS